MPRRNFRVILIVIAVSLLCQKRFSSEGTTFVRALDEIHDHYLQPVDRRVLLHAALRGMASRLDPYSEYIPPVEFTEFQQSLEQQFGGVGIQIDVDPENKRLTVISPMIDSPAYRGGILPGDQILKINGKDTNGFSTADAAKLLRGSPGTNVEVTIRHLGGEKPIDIPLTRSIIKVETVLGDTHSPEAGWNFTLPDHPEIGYIRIVQFGERTAEELDRALQSFSQHPLKGLIIDLRNDPGGLLDQAVKVCRNFMDQGLIVSTRGRNGLEYESFYADGTGKQQHIPMAILVNHYSASASEIVAACLQDWKRAVVVGERTWGKGSVQNLIPLEDRRSALKLTTLSYWRPSGKNIHRLENTPESEDWGVVPNPGCEVKLDKAQFENLLKFRRNRDVVRDANSPASTSDSNLYEADPQLQRAVEILSTESTPK